VFALGGQVRVNPKGELRGFFPPFTPKKQGSISCNILQNEPYLNPEKQLKTYKTTECVSHNTGKNNAAELRLFTIIFGTEF
jgi:hypothetical protein